MNDIPHFGVDPIDPHTLGSRQDKVNNIKRYGFFGKGNVVRYAKSGRNFRDRTAPIYNLANGLLTSGHIVDYSWAFSYAQSRVSD